MTKFMVACVFVVLAIGSVASAQDPLNHPLVVVDTPSEGDSTGRDFAIKGTALNSDFVHVWAVPSSGAVFLGVAYPYQADALRKIQGGSFSLSVYGAPLGSYPIVVYAHEPSTNTFPVGLVTSIQVHACAPYTVSWPFYGVTGWTMVAYQVCG